MSRLVDGKLALVTGAGSGIGRSVCRVLAREGATVIATDQNGESAEQTVAILEGSGHIALQLDVTSSKQVDDAFAKSKEHFSNPPTIVVNSAGIGTSNFILKLSESDFDQVVNVNMKGTFLVVQAAAKAMIEARIADGGSIVNISSTWGKFACARLAHYGASKAGVLALTRTAAIEFGKFGIRVNAVLPGPIDTPLLHRVPEEMKQIWIGKVALGRIGSPDEVAEVVTFLLSERSSYVNGASVEICGGHK